MGIVEKQGTDQRKILAERSLVGRGPECHLILADARVSTEHAAIIWDGVRWWVRDLASRNGTTLNGEHLSPGTQVGLDVGSVLTFGSKNEKWKLVDVAPPDIFADCLEDGSTVEGDFGYLALTPEVRVATEDGRTYQLETPEISRPVVAREVLQVSGRSYRLHLPSQARPERTKGTDEPTAAQDIQLEFVVSPGQDHIETWVILGEASHALPPRVLDEMLLELARAWEAEPDKPSAERGWVYADDLADRLHRSRHHLNIDVYRARERFSRVGVRDPSALLERRIETGALRLMARRIQIKNVDRDIS